MANNDTIFANTIFALATAPGKSGVAVLRVSGTHALQALKTLCRLESVTARSAHYASFFHPATGELIDKGIALFFKGPHSFTGEDVAELQVHGGLAVMRDLLSALSGMKGLRAADAGEFTRRAFLNHKMDLMEAEGLADLIEAETQAQKSQAMRQMQGEFSDFYEQLRTRIIKALAHLEAYIDFPDEDIPESVLFELTSDISHLQSSIEEALQDERSGERVRDGISIAILGAPNVGKSSLLNVIAKRDVAIVSSRAGTTRDVIEVHLDIAGYPVVLVDTAGIRESRDEIEAEGIRRALERAANADIKLVMFDGGQWPSAESGSTSLVDEASFVVVNKCDLLKDKGRESNPFSGPLANPLNKKPLFISTSTGEGVDTLLAAIRQRIVERFSFSGGSFITRARHRALLTEASQYLEKSKQDLPLELKCEELRQAAQAVGKITGKIQVDDVLDVIFKSFCIGK
jgi:tRNA modification GTPase